MQPNAIDARLLGAHDLDMPTLCRSCFAETAEAANVCDRCGSDLLVTHQDLNDLSTAHIDCDAFYANIEKRDNPGLKDKPVLVGGGKRGVVMAACYVARLAGVHSAMPMFKALKACPEAVVIKPDMTKYVAVGRSIREMMRNVTPLVEPISIDEAFLDLKGTSRLHGASPAHTVARLAANIQMQHDITVTIGLSYNKFLAKLASGLNKPHGFTIIGRAETSDFLANLPVSHIWGVGKVLQKKLERDGITLIGHLQSHNELELTARYGQMGHRLARLCHGHDSRKVVAGGRRKSLSSETTFEEDITDAKTLKRILWRQAEKVSASLKKEGIGGRTITLKLKSASFKIRTRSQTLSHPTQTADVIYRTAEILLENEADGTAYRLLGVGLSALEQSDHCDPLDLADPNAQRRKQAEVAVDKIRARFGRNVIGKGRMIEK